MPFLGAQRWLRQRAPSVLALLIVALMSASLAWQSVAWQRLLRAPAATNSTATDSQAHTPDMQALLPLFGSAPVADSGVAPNTNLRLTLLGSFVDTAGKGSSAIIQLEGSPAKRYAVGQELSSGVLLHAVYRDRVELKRNGRLETLAFSNRKTTPASGLVSPAPDSENLAQLQALSEEDTLQLQQRMQALRDQLQATDDAPAPLETTEPTEPSTEAY